MSKQDKNTRQCIHCKKLNKKENFIRLTKDYKTNEIKFNPESSIQGRSVYICKNKECIESALKKKKIENSLKSKLPENIKDYFNTVLNN